VAHSGQPATVREQHAQRDVLLAGLRDPGPDLAQRSIEREQSLFDQREHEHRRDALADRVDVHQRVALPRLGVFAVLMPAPQIHDHAAVDEHADGGAEFVACAEVFAERSVCGGEGRIAESRDGCVDRGSGIHGGSHLAGRMGHPGRLYPALEVLGADVVQRECGSAQRRVFVVRLLRDLGSAVVTDVRR
jgi:hypothetical protein